MVKAGSSDMYSFGHYLYGEAYLGSYKGLRFRLARDPLENVIFSDNKYDAEFLASIWDEPWSWEHKDIETLREERFPFTEEGFKSAVEWLNGVLLERDSE